MKYETKYNKYVQECKEKRIYPISYYLWIENILNKPKKANVMEIGFDLNVNFTGKSNGTSFSTSEGESLS